MESVFGPRIAAVQARIGSLSEPLSADESSHMTEALAELSSALEELRVADEELRQQNEALATARSEAEEESRKYRELFEHAPGGYLVTDKDGMITQANRQAALMLGKPAD